MQHDRASRHSSRQVAVGPSGMWPPGAARPGPGSAVADRLVARAFVRDVAAAALPTGPGDDAPVTEDEVAHLAEPVRRYLRFLGVVGRPRVWSFSVDFRGRFRMRPDGPWMPAVGRQHNTLRPVARVFSMVLRLGGVVPMVGHDTYLAGRGRMVGKIGGVVTVADGTGMEFDVGELTTWVDDAVLLAPSMLLSVGATWTAVGGDAFEVAVLDADHEVRVRVDLDGRGAPVDVSSTDRWAALPGGLVQARWHTPPTAWIATVGGAPFPAPGPVTWDLPDGPFTYTEGGFVPGTFRPNIPPPTGAPPR